MNFYLSKSDSLPSADGWHLHLLQRSRYVGHCHGPTMTDPGTYQSREIPAAGGSYRESERSR